jgi:hypothetical protein
MELVNVSTDIRQGQNFESTAESGFRDALKRKFIPQATILICHPVTMATVHRRFADCAYRPVQKIRHSVQTGFGIVAEGFPRTKVPFFSVRLQEQVRYKRKNCPVFEFQ